MNFIGHHTCRKNNGYHYVLKEAPFLSIHDPVTKKHSFLGTGYYYWDDDFERAKEWGRKHYNNSFFILESELELEMSYFLDLVGNRQDQKNLLSLIRGAMKRGCYGEEWHLANYIELFKELNEEDEERIFPYMAIRAHDVSEKIRQNEKFQFVKVSERFINLRPRYIICLTKKKPLISRSKIAFES